MNVFQCLDGFQFDDDLPVHEQIQPMHADLFVLENDGYFFLCFVDDAAMPQGDP